MSILEDKTANFSFIDKLAYVVENGELDLWEDRRNPPNLSIEEFKLIIIRSDKVINLKWIHRESNLGDHGKTGEEFCFKFNCEISFGGIFEIETKSYFIKGYFFDKGNLTGVTIQSFRREI